MYPNNLKVNLCQVGAHFGASYASKLTDRTLKIMMALLLLLAAPLVPIRHYVTGLRSCDASNPTQANSLVEIATASFSALTPDSAIKLTIVGTAAGIPIHPPVPFLLSASIHTHTHQKYALLSSQEF